MKQKEKEALESLTSYIDHLVKELDNYTGYLRLGDASEQLREEAMEIMKKKVKKLKKAETEKDYKKVIKVNKFLDKSGL
jgi:glutamyl-tRNA reductase